MKKYIAFGILSMSSGLYAAGAILPGCANSEPDRDRIEQIKCLNLVLGAYKKNNSLRQRLSQRSSKANPNTAIAEGFKGYYNKIVMDEGKVGTGKTYQKQIAQVGEARSILERASRYGGFELGKRGEFRLRQERFIGGVFDPILYKKSFKIGPGRSANTLQAIRYVTPIAHK